MENNNNSDFRANSQDATLSDFSAPRIFVGSYQILEEIGSGGMGKVYKVFHQGLQKTLAMKVMLRDNGHNEKERQRFLDEARYTAQLKHPNIVNVHDIGRYKQKDYIVMDYIEGQSLAQVLKKLTTRKSLLLMEKIALAIHYAHTKNIIHRDLKPSNIIIENNEQNPIVMDFGLAKNVSLENGMTKTGEVIGTPRYMAPEQARGKNREVSNKTDIYSLGCILYEMISKKTVVKGRNTVNILYNVHSRRSNTIKRNCTYSICRVTNNVYESHRKRSCSSLFFF